MPTATLTGQSDRAVLPNAITVYDGENLTIVFESADAWDTAYLTIAASSQDESPLFSRASGTGVFFLSLDDLDQFAEGGTFVGFVYTQSGSSRLQLRARDWRITRGYAVPPVLGMTSSNEITFNGEILTFNGEILVFTPT